jgi:hypothetical protein
MRYGRSFIALVLVSILVCVFSASCEDETGPYYTFFYIEIDSLSAPAEIMQTDTLEIAFYSVPLSCCYNFYRFDTPDIIEMDNCLHIRMIGRETHNLLCSCLPRVIEMDYEVVQMLTGYFYIEVMQPDGSALLDSVLVYR